MATTSEGKVDRAGSTDSREIEEKTNEKVERLERELEEIKPFVKLKSLFPVMIVSFALVLIGTLLIFSSVFLSSYKTISPLLSSFGSTILPIGLWGLYFELAGRRDMMREIELRLRDVVKTSLKDDVIGKLDALDSQVRSVKEFELKLRDIVREEHGEIRSRLGSLSRLIDSGIVDYDSYGKRQEVLELLGGAKRSIRVCKTWIPEAEVAAVTQGLQKALANRTERPAVRILCLDPDSPLAVQRSRDLNHEHQTDGSDLIRRGLKAVHDLRREEGWLDSVSIRTYTNLPSVSLYSADDTSLVGWYWHSQPAFEGPILRIMGTDYALGREVETNFEAMWKAAHEYIPNIGDDSILDNGYVQLPRAVVPELSRMEKVNDAPALDQLRGRVIPHWPELTKLGQDILQRTSHQGYLVVRNFPFNELTQHERRALFLLLVSFCGTPESHISGRDEFVWDVTPRDTFRQSTYSENSDEAPLHTDSHYRETPEEFIAVLVEQPAKCGGGRTTLLRIAPVLNELEETAEGTEYLEILRTQRFPSLIPEVYREGDRKLTESPIVIGNTVRFRPDTIEAGMSIKEYQTGGRLEAFNRFDQAIKQSPDRLSVFLRRGDMLFINNRTTLHGRTSFKDNERLLLRVRFNASS